MLKRQGLLAPLAILLLVACVGPVYGDLQSVWRIGGDEDPFASGYNATDEFAQEQGGNTLRPSRVTRVPGDPLYNAGTTLRPTMTSILLALTPLASTD